MFGVPVPTVPKAKQFGTESVIGELLARNVSVIAAGAEVVVTSGKAGVRTTTAEGVTEVTGASRVMPSTVNVARVVVASPGNRPPLIVRLVPPEAAPNEGLQLEKKGTAWAEGWKTIFNGAAFAELPATFDEALTKAVPVRFEQRDVKAVPFVVTTEIVGPPFWEKVPKSAENATPVPSATATPFNVTIAWMRVHVPAVGLASPVNRMI
jgi:hypothetical protein